MTIMDRNGRLFGKISIIDVIVVLAVVVLAAALYVKTHQPETGVNVTDQYITYQVKMTNQPQYVVDALAVGDQLYDKERSTNGSLGEIIQIDVEPGTQQTNLMDGTIADVPCEDRYNIVLTVRGKGLYNEKDGYMLNRIYALGANSSRNLNTKYAWFTVGVLNVSLDGQTAQ